MALAPYIPLVQAPELITLKFRLQYTSADKADFQCPAKSIASNTHTSTGLYTMTFNEKYPVFIGGFGHVMTAIAGVGTDDLSVRIDVAGYVPTTGVLTYSVVGLDGTTAVEDVPDNDWIYFELTFCRRSTLCPVGAIT
jgi:hypothetical protein